MAVGSICSVIMGAALPLFYFITGDMINTFNEGDNIKSLALENLIRYIILAVSSLILGMIMFSFWMITGERQAMRCRK